MCHVHPCLLSCPLPSCYLILVNLLHLCFARYPPHLLPIYSPCVCSPVPVRCRMLSVLLVFCLVLPCPSSASLFPQRGSFFKFIFLLLLKPCFHLRVLASSLYPHLTERTGHHEDSTEEGLVPSTSLHALQPSVPTHAPVQDIELPPSTGG